MVRLPDVERPPNRENPGRSNDCGSEARRPVWLAGGFAGRAGAPGADSQLGKGTPKNELKTFNTYQP